MIQLAGRKKYKNWIKLLDSNSQSLLWKQQKRKHNKKQFNYWLSLKLLTFDEWKSGSQDLQVRWLWWPSIFLPFTHDPMIWGFIVKLLAAYSVIRGSMMRFNINKRYCLVFSSKKKKLARLLNQLLFLPKD